MAILPSNIIMIGVSEYSTAYLTTDGKQLVENAILYQLGIDIPTNYETTKSHTINHKFIHNGVLYIQTGDAVYDTFGRRTDR